MRAGVHWDAGLQPRDVQVRMSAGHDCLRRHVLYGDPDLHKRDLLSEPDDVLRLE